MPVSIVLTDVSWSTPDGRDLFSHLDLTFAAERTGLVGRNGVGKSTLLKLIDGRLVPRTGRIAVNGTFATLHQAVQVEAGVTIAGLFGVSPALAILRRAESGEATAEDLAAADWTLEDRVTAALRRTGLDLPADTPLTALSGGQRTRAGLAALIFARPDILLLDEPTNNLDADGRRAVRELLAGWRGCAVVVSHDRELLDGMEAVVDLTTLGATRYGGNWTAYDGRKAVELAAAHGALADAEKHAAEVARAVQTAAERKARKDGAGARQAAGGGTPHILLGARKARSENSGGQGARLAERRQEAAGAAVLAARQRVEVLQPLSVTVPSSRLAADKPVLRLAEVTAGYEPGRPVIRALSFAIIGPERIAVSGPNGAGKTTLLALIAGRLRPWSGEVRVGGDVAVLDQRMALLDPTASIRDNFRRLNPRADDRTARAALARFMFRADTALQTAGSLSGGQMLRAGLACVLGTTPPGLLVLDEPTNHLDLDSIAAVEAGLAAYDGALLVVSHDEAFLDRVGVSRRLELQPPYLPS